MANSGESPQFTKIELEIIRTIGLGAGSTISLVRDKATRKPYALKQVERKGPEDDIYIQQALHEFEVARLLRHRSLLTIYDCRTRRSWFKVAAVELLMEYVDGAVLDEIQSLTLKQLVAVFRRVADALSHMHRRGIYHGDLKPGNVMVSKQGEVKVIDFGTAWIRGENKDRIQGTPEYMAPEQENRKVVDDRTDLYNLGATMYRMFTGQHANLGILGLNASRVSRRMLQPPIAIVGGLPKELSDLIMECLQANPNRRPSSVREVRLQLDEIAKKLRTSSEKSLDEDRPS